jgi:hypothetical protein
MCLDVEQTQLKHREQSDGPSTDDQHIGLDRFAHPLNPATAGSPLATKVVMPTDA